MMAQLNHRSIGESIVESVGEISIDMTSTISGENFDTANDSEVPEVIYQIGDTVSTDTLT